MRDYVTKVDNAAPSPSGILGADEDNARFEELKQAVLTAMIALDAIGGPDTSRNMLAQAMARYASGGIFCRDVGAANAYILSTPNLFVLSKGLFTGLMAEFYPGHNNTGPSTVNYNGLGSKPLLAYTGAALAGGEILSGTLTAIVYDATLNTGTGAWKIKPWASLSAPVDPPPSNVPARNIQSYTVAGNYTFVVPTGVTWLWVRIVGGGGGGAGGGGSSPFGGGGGGSGGYAESWIAVTPGDHIAVTVGAKGVGGPNANAYASSGTPSAFGSYMSATGGTGGHAGPPGSGGGGPGVGSGGQLNLYGGYGADGDNTGSNFGGSGASSHFGGGGRDSTVTGLADHGLAPGSGGGGTYGYTGGPGGDGADGAVIVMW